MSGDSSTRVEKPGLFSRTSDLGTSFALSLVCNAFSASMSSLWLSDLEGLKWSRVWFQFLCSENDMEPCLGDIVEPGDVSFMGVVPRTGVIPWVSRVASKRSPLRSCSMREKWSTNSCTSPPPMLALVTAFLRTILRLFPDPWSGSDSSWVGDKSTAAGSSWVTFISHSIDSLGRFLPAVLVFCASFCTNFPSLWPDHSSTNPFLIAA